MTVGGDFIPVGDENGYEEPNYPVVFGIKLTPTINGVLLALAGLAGGVYLLLNVVQPTWNEHLQLRQDIAQKEAQLVDQGQAQQQIEDARKRLKESEQLRADVLALFATEESLDTLLLDLNARVQSANARIADEDRRATLVKFELVPPTTPSTDGQTGDVVTDSSFGAAANGRLRQQIYNVEMQGTFAQTQSIIRSIERLEPLLVVRNLKSELPAPPVLVLNAQGRPIAAAQEEPRLKTTYQLQALIPVPPAPPTPAPAASPGASPAASPPAQ